MQRAGILARRKIFCQASITESIRFSLHANYTCTYNHLAKFNPTHLNSMLGLTKRGEEVRLGAQLTSPDIS
jgi:hypothetical protein